MVSRSFQTPSYRICGLSRTRGRQNLKPDTENTKESAMKRILAATILTLILAITQNICADPLDFCPKWTTGAETFISWIEGRMGFDLQNGGWGTQNDLTYDLGLPQQNYTYRVFVASRPLPHHAVRVFGSIPEQYTGQSITKRQLRTTRYPVGVTTATNSNVNDASLTYPQNSGVNSSMNLGMYGVGYDLDFIVGPTWFAGFNGDLRYLDLKLKMWGSTRPVPPVVGAAPPENPDVLYNEDTINLDELVPCLGAHVEALLPMGASCSPPRISLGGFTRMSYGITPNYLNYVDITAGISLNSAPWAPVALNARFGVEHESIFHDSNIRSGRMVELKRNGFIVQLEGTF
jgi:hypothetical protein